MKYYLLKLFYLLSVYLIIFLFLFFYSLISNYFYSNKKNNEFIFLQKLYENKTYYLKDFILDAPFILNWLSYFRFWSFFLGYSIIFLIFIIVKPLQMIIILFYLPFYALYFLHHIFQKKEIKYNFHVKHNTSLKDIIYLIFFYIPLAYLFNRFYLILKAMYKKDNRPSFSINVLLINIFHTSYRFVYKFLFGLPLWNLYLIHKITYDLIICYENYFEKKEIKELPLLIKIRNRLIASHQKSYVFSAWRERIYFVNEKIHFNPPKAITHFIENNDCNFTFKNISTYSNTGLKIIYHKHTILEDEITRNSLQKINANFSLPMVYTKRLLPIQTGVYYNKVYYWYDKEGNLHQKDFKQYISINNCVASNIIQDHPTSGFIAYPYEPQQCSDVANLLKITTTPGLVVQNFKEEPKLLFPNQNIYCALQNYGEKIENESMINFARTQIEYQNEVKEYFDIKEIDKLLLFKNKNHTWIEMLDDVPLLLSKANNPIKASIENRKNIEKIQELKNNTSLSNEYKFQKIKEINEEIREKYNYSKEYRDFSKFKDFKD